MLRIALTAGVLALAGCSTPARFVERNPAGGVVAVPDYAHRDDGLGLIHRQIGPMARIVEESEVATGEDTKTIVETGDGSIFTRIASWFTGTKHVATTETKSVKSTEWRIKYEVVPPQR
jgi:hypothetical protein